MSRTEIIKSPIISVVRSPANGASSAHGSKTTAAWQPNEAITTFAWNSSPIAVIEQVELTAQLDPRLAALIAPGSAEAQAYRMLEHRLYAKADPRVIAITSAEPGAGKTTCAANLALVLAEAALARVLLIDANLTRPGVADLFGFEPADSLMTKLLRSEDSAPPYAVASVSHTSLQLAALHRDAGKGKRLDRALFSEALRSLRSAYDYVVIDTASALESADVNSVSQCSDGVVMVARAGKSHRSALRKAIQQLQPANVLGTVLID
jgi:Mrp family chromosome partitioning ATPase